MLQLHWYPVWISGSSTSKTNRPQWQLGAVRLQRRLLCLCHGCNLLGRCSVYRYVRNGGKVVARYSVYAFELGGLERGERERSGPGKSTAPLIICLEFHTATLSALRRCNPGGGPSRRAPSRRPSCERETCRDPAYILRSSYHQDALSGDSFLELAVAWPVKDLLGLDSGFQEP